MTTSVEEAPHAVGGCDILAVLHFCVVELRSVLLIYMTFVNLVSRVTSLDLVETHSYPGRELGNGTLAEYLHCAENAGERFTFGAWGHLSHECDLPLYIDGKIEKGSKMYFATEVGVAPLTYVSLALGSCLLVMQVVVQVQRGCAPHTTGKYLRASEWLRESRWFRYILIACLLSAIGSTCYGLSVLQPSVWPELLTSAILLTSRLLKLRGNGVKVPLDIESDAFANIRFKRRWKKVISQSAVEFFEDLTSTLQYTKRTGDRSKLNEMLLDPDKDADTLLKLQASRIDGAKMFAEVVDEANSKDTLALRVEEKGDGEEDKGEEGVEEKEGPDVMAWLHCLLVETLRGVAIVVLTLYGLFRSSRLQHVLLQHGDLTGFEIGDTEMREVYRCFGDFALEEVTSSSLVEKECELSGTRSSLTLKSTSTSAAGVFWLSIVLSIALTVVIISYFVTQAGPYASGRYLAHSIEMHRSLLYKVIVRGIIAIIVLSAVIYGLIFIDQSVALSFIIAAFALGTAFRPFYQDPPIEIPSKVIRKIRMHRGCLHFPFNNDTQATRLVNAVLALQLQDSKYEGTQPLHAESA